MRHRGAPPPLPHRRMDTAIHLPVGQRGADLYHSRQRHHGPAAERPLADTPHRPSRTHQSRHHLQWRGTRQQPHSVTVCRGQRPQAHAAPTRNGHNQQSARRPQPLLRRRAPSPALQRSRATAHFVHPHPQPEIGRVSNHGERTSRGKPARDMKL